MVQSETNVDKHEQNNDTALSPTTLKQDAHGSHEAEDRFALFASKLLDRIDSVVYALVGICFLIAAVLALGYTFWQFSANTLLNLPHLTPTDAAQAIIELISGLLLVLIIVEILGTVIHYLKSHTTSLRPFLFIGIISATRSILSIGARLSVGNGHMQGIDYTFIYDMVELAVSAVVILALGVTLKLLGKITQE
jgi:uncharacterized membrane protein (DUF373 family)